MSDKWADRNPAYQVRWMPEEASSVSAVRTLQFNEVDRTVDVGCLRVSPRLTRLNEYLLRFERDPHRRNEPNRCLGEKLFTAVHKLTTAFASDPSRKGWGLEENDQQKEIFDHPREKEVAEGMQKIRSLIESKADVNWSFPFQVHFRTTPPPARAPVTRCDGATLPVRP